MTTDAFAALEPEALWRHFGALTRIPRATYEEERAVAYVQEWARQRNLTTRRDETGNLVVDVPAMPGREGAPTVILQGHLDMVCEREPDSPYDPREGRIGVVRDGEWVRAEGTTLGADNGVAIAAMLALVEDPEAVHGPLELLMTVQEEIGLAGAAELDPELISGSVLLNLDTEEDGTFTVGCAGGVDSMLRIDLRRTDVPPSADQALWVAIRNGRGGHSGADIDKGRANAIKLLAHALSAAPGIRLASLKGGASRNAIPRDAEAIVIAPDESARGAIEAAGITAASAYQKTDPGVTVSVTPTEPPGTAWAAQDSARMIDLIAALPNGPLGMSQEFPGVVETSSSIGVAETENGRLTVRSLSRSANDAAMPAVMLAIAAAGRLAGAEVEFGHHYPGWRPDLDSPTLKTAKQVHARVFGRPARVVLEHGGLEAGVIGARKPGLDMLSLGPQIKGPHAPGERLHIGSAQRFMRLLNALLDELSR